MIKLQKEPRLISRCRGLDSDRLCYFYGKAGCSRHRCYNPTVAYIEVTA